MEKEFPGISQNLNAFLDGIAGINVLLELGTESLILRWNPEDGKTWNLGTISKRAELSSGNQMASLFLCRMSNRGFGADKSQSMTWA